jgi:hypothetical protein
LRQSANLPFDQDLGSSRPAPLSGERQGLEDCATLGIDSENAVLGEGSTGEVKLGSKRRRGSRFSDAADKQDRWDRFIVKNLDRRSIVNP